MAEFNVDLNSKRPIQADQVRGLYDQVNWWPNRRVEDIARMLDTGPSVGAWDGGRLIGFARAVSDGVFRAYIEDVMVDEAYRRQGVGEALMAKLSEALQPIEVVSLFCKSDLTPFYETSGFLPTSQVVMHHKQEIKR